MKILAVRLWNLAGYKSLAWERTQHGLNLLLGANGAGKSSLLQALACSLLYIAGRRTEDILTRTYPDAEAEITFDGISSSQHFLFSDINKSQTPAKSTHKWQVLQFVEQRQPKSVVGDARNSLQQHPTSRYANALSEVKFLLGSNEEDRKVGLRVLELCKTINASGRKQDWEWIESAIRERSPRKARPVSCGQFDLVALLLDLARLENLLQTDPQPAFILIDNPETFLHPACQEPLLRMVLDLIPDGQLFVASHSLKLLCHREPKEVFWLSRQSYSEQGEVRIVSIRELEKGAKEAFFDLYGNDVSSAVLGLLTTFDTPEYYKFLCECALPPKVEMRSNPLQDRQIQSVLDQACKGKIGWVILDFGAGHGDVLQGLINSTVVHSNITYIAEDTNRSPILLQRMGEAKKKGRISADSKFISDLSEAPANCDTIIFLNVCHEMLLPTLSTILGRVLSQHMRRSESSRVVIHEAKSLSVGEQRFIMWTSVDYEEVFNRIPGIRVERYSSPPPGVDLETTVISLTGEQLLADNLTEQLANRFWSRLPAKKEECLREMELLLNKNTPTGDNFQEAIRQRKLAFFMAQFAHISLLECQQTKTGNECG